MIRHSPEPDPFIGLADDAAHEAAVLARVGERDRQELATQLATWTGSLRDLAERGTPVSLRTGSDRTHRGVLRAVGVDHVTVALVGGDVVLVALAELRTVRPEPGQRAPTATGDRVRSQDRTFAEALQRIVEDRADVVLVLRDLPDPLVGDIVGLGEDVLTLRLRGGDRGTVYVPVEAICELLLAG